MQTGSDKNNFNPDFNHDSDDQLDDNVNFDDEDLIEEEFNDQKKRIQWSKWLKIQQQKNAKKKQTDLTESKLFLLRNWSACFLCSSLVLFCIVIILYFATYPYLADVKIILNILITFSLASDVITVSCYLALRWWSYRNAKKIAPNQNYSFALWRLGLIVIFVLSFILQEIWWILLSVSTIPTLTLSLIKLYSGWGMLLGCMWFIFAILLLAYFGAKSMLNKAIELKHAWFWLTLIFFFGFLIIAYFVFGGLAINHESFIPGKALFMTAAILGIFGIYPTIMNYRLYLNELFA